MNPRVIQCVDTTTLTGIAMHASSTGELLGRMTELAGELKALRVHHEWLDPGRRSSRPHHHTTREECIFVIEGELTLRTGDQEQSLAAGGFVALPPGPPVHVVSNRSDRPAAMLVFSTAPTPDTVIYEGPQEG